ncbi:MAG: hypothetical protein ACREWG_05870 [Gammaproteobacteria bacterium]
MLPDDYPVHVRFCNEVLGLFPYQLRSAWDRLVDSGTGQAPLQVGDPVEMRNRIDGDPGAIGYATNTVIGGNEADWTLGFR